MTSARTYFDRDMDRGRRAAERVRAAGGTAIQCMEAQFDATFSASVRHSAFKARVADLMKRGARDPEVTYRFRVLADRYIDAPLDISIVLIEQMRRAEINCRETAIRTWGRYSGTNTRLRLLDELRLILRWLARHAPERYEALRDTVRGEN